MKLLCDFKYIKELGTYPLKGIKEETIHIYEYSVKRTGFLKNTTLILYMICKANKDGYASDKNIHKGFYTLKQALEFMRDRYVKEVDENAKI